MQLASKSAVTEVPQSQQEATNLKNVAQIGFPASMLSLIDMITVAAVASVIYSHPQDSIHVSYKINLLQLKPQRLNVSCLLKNRKAL